MTTYDNNNNINDHTNFTTAKVKKEVNNESATQGEHGHVNSKDEGHTT